MLRNTPLEMITPKDGQPRQRFDDESLRELAQSMAENGLVTPITVRTNGRGYEIVAGERRYRAAKLLDWESIEARVEDYEDDEAYIASFIENEQRDNLSPVETAEALQTIMDAQELTQAGVARRVGRSRSWVAQKLRLLNLSTETQALVKSGELSEGHGRQLLKLQTAGEDRAIEALGERAAREGWSVARLQSEVDTTIAGEPDTEKVTTGSWLIDAVLDRLHAACPGLQVTPTSLEFPEGVSYEEWLAVGRVLIEVRMLIEDSRCVT